MRSLAPQTACLVACLLAFAASGLGADQRAMDDAVAALGRGDFPAAERTLRAEVEADPDNAGALSLLGVALDNQNKVTEADEFHRKAIARAPRSADIQTNYGVHLTMAGDQKAAREAFLAAVSIDPAHVGANLQLARMALSQGDGPEALSCLKRIPPAQQEAPRVMVLNMQALYSTGARDEADALADKLSAASQNDPALSYSAGMALGSANQFEKAEPFLSRALAAAPADFGLLYHVGVAASMAGHNERALEVLDTALRQQPDNVSVLYSMAWANEGLNRRDAAIALLARAARLEPKRADVQKMLAIIAGELKAWADSAAAWERYLALEPGDDAGRRERGFSYVRLGEFDKGMADLQWFAEQHPDDVDGQLELGLAQTDTDQPKALARLDKALALKPDLVVARSARGSLYYQMGKPESALADLEFAAQRDPSDGITLDHLGQTYVALDRPADAVLVLRKAAELLPGDSRVQLHFAHALADAGQTAESKAVMERFRQLGPSKNDTVPAGLVDYLSLTPEQRRADYRSRVEQAVKKDPNDVSAQLLYLQLSLDDGAADRAAATARRIAELKPPPESLAKAGRALLESNQYSLARQLLEQAQAAAPAADLQLDIAIAAFRAEGPKAGIQMLDRVPEPARSGDYYLARAQMLDASGRPADAAAALEQALRASPTRPDLYWQTAAYLVKNGKAQDALRALDSAAPAVAQDRQIVLAKAIAMETAAQTAGSSELLKEVQSRWPEWSAGWVVRGMALAAHGQFAEADQALQTAVSLGAHGPEVYYAVAECLLRAEPPQPGPAETAIAQALKLAPGDPWIQAMAGQIASANGDHLLATRRLGEAIRLRPGLAEAHDALARAYDALGRKAEAQAEMEQAKKLQPGDGPHYLSSLFLNKPLRDW